MKLSFKKLPEFIFSSYRQFEKGEHHIERYVNEFVLILMHSGKLRFEENGKKITVNAGEYYIQRPNLHQTGNDESDCPNYYYIHFYGTLTDDEGLPLSGTFIENSVKPYIEELEILGKDAPALEIAKNFYSILSAIAKQDNDSVAFQIKNLITQNYSKDISLEKLCKTVGFSKNSVIRIFKNEFGCTPYRYLTEFRLEKARQLLLTSTIPCDKVSVLAGFASYQVFFKSFSKEYKISPQHFRAQYKNKMFSALKNDNKND